MQADNEEKAAAWVDIEQLKQSLSDTKQEALVLRAKLQDRTEEHTKKVHAVFLHIIATMCQLGMCAILRRHCPGRPQMPGSHRPLLHL